MLSSENNLRTTTADTPAVGECSNNLLLFEIPKSKILDSTPTDQYSQDLQIALCKLNLMQSNHARLMSITGVNAIHITRQAPPPP